MTEINLDDAAQPDAEFPKSDTAPQSFDGPHCPVCQGHKWNNEKFDQCLQCGYLMHLGDGYIPPEMAEEMHVEDRPRIPEAGEILAAFLPEWLARQSQPVTRCERFIHTILSSNTSILPIWNTETLDGFVKEPALMSSEKAKWVVQFARNLEKAMDTPNE